MEGIIKWKIHQIKFDVGMAFIFILLHGLYSMAFVGIMKFEILCFYSLKVEGMIFLEILME